MPTPVTMPKGQYLTEFEKAQISALRAEGFVIREIAEKIGQGHNIVYNPDTYGRNHGGGQPQAMTPHEERQFCAICPIPVIRLIKFWLGITSMFVTQLGEEWTTHSNHSDTDELGKVQKNAILKADLIGPEST
ncbi:hypothetical protein Aperf_G00000057357 [Anoplocephala perfoliata]